MLTLKEYIILGLIESTVPTNVTTGVANPDSPFKTTKAFGYNVIDVDKDIYYKCAFGKKKFSRWKGVVEDEELRNFIKTQYNKNPNIIVRNKDTNAMTLMRQQ